MPTGFLMPATAINTATVKNRRQLHFNSLDEIAAEVERLAACQQVRTIGNWSSGQVLQHLASTMDNSIDGFPNFVQRRSSSCCECS